MTPYPVGTVVDYHGSHAHGRYVITEHEVPRAGVPAANYPDGVAYVIWREGVLRKFGNREFSLVIQVRRESMTPVTYPVPHCRSHLEFRSDCEPCRSAREFG